MPTMESGGKVRATETGVPFQERGEMMANAQADAQRDESEKDRDVKRPRVALL